MTESLGSADILRKSEDSSNTSHLLHASQAAVRQTALFKVGACRFGLRTEVHSSHSSNGTVKPGVLEDGLTDFVS
jgi:hypothetical protein